MKTHRLRLRAVFYRQNSRWIAHCLELDLVGDGTTMDKALHDLVQAIRCQIEATVKHKNLKNLFTPAEGKYFAMFAAGKHVAVGELKFTPKSAPLDHVQIEEVDTREYSDTDSNAELVGAW